MKTVIPLLACALLGYGSQAQPRAKSLFDQYASSGQVTSFSFQYEMTDIFDFDFDWQEYARHVSGDFEQIRVLCFQNYQDGRQKLKEIEEKLQKKDLIETNLKNEGDFSVQTLKLYAYKERDHFRKLYLLLNNSENQEAVLAIFHGDLQLKNKDE